MTASSHIAEVRFDAKGLVAKAVCGAKTQSSASGRAEGACRPLGGIPQSPGDCLLA